MHPPDDRAVVAGSYHQIDDDFASIAEEVSNLTKVRKKLQAETSYSRSAPKIDLARLPLVGEHLLGRETELTDLDSAWSDELKKSEVETLEAAHNSTPTKSW